MAFQEMVFGQFEHDRQQLQELKRYIFMHMAGKFLDLIPVFSDDFRLRSLSLRDAFEDAIELKGVLHPGFNVDRTKGSVPIIASFFQRGPIFESLFFRESKECFGDCELSVDLFLGEADVGDIEEALLSVSADPVVT